MFTIALLSAVLAQAPSTAQQPPKPQLYEHLGKKLAGLVVQSPAKKVFALKLDISRFPDLKLRNDLNVTVWGKLQPTGIEMWIIELAPPGLQWASELQNPGAVIGGSNQTFHVNIAIKNTGKQPFVAVKGVVRLWQIDSPNDWTQEIVVENLLPGQTRTLTVPFEIFNYQYIGKSSVPQCAFTVTDFR